MPLLINEVYNENDEIKVYFSQINIIQANSIWILANIASGTEENINTLMENNILTVI